MTSKLRFNIVVIIAILILNVSCYELNSVSGCSNSDHQQSPININTSTVLYREEKFFRIITTDYENLNSTWKYFPEDQTLGFEGKLGAITFVKDWSLYRFNLERIQFRTKSAHSINGEFADVEMELIHRLDETYRTPGKYIYPTSKILVISIFFTSIANDRTDKTSDFFTYLNLEELEKGTSFPNPLRPVKIGRIVQNNPAYYYEGGLTSTNSCEKAWRFIMPSYQVIKKDQLTLLILAMTKRGISISSNGSNSRSQMLIKGDIEVYRNEIDPNNVQKIAHPNQYDLSKIVRIDVFVILFSLFCLFF